MPFTRYEISRKPGHPEKFLRDMSKEHGTLVHAECGGELTVLENDGESMVNCPNCADEGDYVYLLGNKLSFDGLYFYTSGKFVEELDGGYEYLEPGQASQFLAELYESYKEQGLLEDEEIPF